MANAVLKAVIAASAVATAGGIGWWLYTQLQQLPPGTATACLVAPSGGCAQEVTVGPGDAVELSVTVPNSTAPVGVQAVINGTPASVHPWNPATQGYTYTIDFFTVAPGTADSTNDIYAVVTFADGSSATTNSTTLNIGSSSTSCTGNQVACRCSGSVVACCPPGESCADCTSGNCPSGTNPDPANIGCCIAAGLVGPASYNGPSTATVTNDVCQPCDIAGACGAAQVEQNLLYLTIQVIDTNGNPMTGADVQVLLNGAVTTDQSVYRTDDLGQIYPAVTSDDNPTATCGSSGGLTGVGSATLEFYVVGFAPDQGWPYWTVTLSLDVNYTTCGGFLGSCGNCQSATSC